MLEVRCSNCGAKVVLGDEDVKGTLVGKQTAAKMNGTVYIATEKEMWDEARTRAENVAVAENIIWEDIPKEEREDRVFAQYENVKQEIKNKGEIKMVKPTKKEERMEALKAMGFNLSALPAGFDVDSLFRESKSDPVLEKIYANGHVKSVKTHKRKLPAQYVGLLGWFDGTKSYDEWTKNLRQSYDMNYAVNFLKRHVHHLAKLEEGDADALAEETQFFDMTVIYDTAKYYTDLWKKQIAKLPVKDYCGVPQIKYHGQYINTSAIETQLFKPVDRLLACIKYASSYRRLETAYNEWLKHKNLCVLDSRKLYIGLPDFFIEAYKGAGAYFAAQDFIRFDGLRVDGCDKYQSEEVLKQKAREYKHEFFRLHAWVKELLKDNDFNLKEVIANK